MDLEELGLTGNGEEEWLLNLWQERHQSERVCHFSHLVTTDEPTECVDDLSELLSLAEQEDHNLTHIVPDSLSEYAQLFMALHHNEHQATHGNSVTISQLNAFQVSSIKIAIKSNVMLEPDTFSTSFEKLFKATEIDNLLFCFVWFFKLIILCRFCQMLFLPFYPINMEFGHHIPRVVRYSAMIFLSHPACSSAFIQNFLDHYAALQMQKAVSAYL